MRQKKILILSSSGGYGHIAAANTLKRLLNIGYEIEVVYPIQELRFYGVPCGESFYDFLIKNNLTRLTNWIVKNIAFPLFKKREEKTMKLIEKHLKRLKPDVLISLIPFVNYPASEAARRENIPFLIVTTDNDLYTWVFSLEKRGHTNFKVTIGSDLPTTKSLLLDHLVPESSIEITGLPLCPDFIHPKNKQQLRLQYDIRQNKKVVLLMMGGAGAKCAYDYARVIMQTYLNVHLIVCAGKNRALARKLKKIKPVNGNSMDIIPFTEKVHELIVLSDLVVTKSGPGTINEVIALKLPLLIDRTGVPLFWEEANIEMVLSFKIGEEIHEVAEAPTLIERYLYDEKLKEEVARAYEHMASNQFAEQIQQVIESMCTVTSAVGEVSVSARSRSS